LSSTAFFNQFFWPDTAATGQYLADVVTELSREQEQPAVICGPAQYGAVDHSAPPRARILRAVQFPFSRGYLPRAVSYATFISTACWHALRLRRTGVAITMTTPPLLSLTGNLMQAVHKTRHVIWEMDVYPDVAIELGVFPRDSRVSRTLSRVASWSRRRADSIIVIGEEMKVRLVRQGIPAEKIHVCENWADGKEITPRPFPDGALHVHYSGNLGLAHDIATIREIMLALRDDNRFRFTFAGGGSRRPALESFCKKHRIANAAFTPYAARADLGMRLSEGHIGLVTQKSETLGSVVPSKTYGIMAAGRPVLFIGPGDATPARIVEEFQCGWHIEPGDGAGLRDLLQTLNSHRPLIYHAGARARRAFEQNYDRRIGVARICNVLAQSQQTHAEATRET